MGRPALVSLTFDDGLRCQFERGLPILDRHGFRATFFLIANTNPIHIDGGQHPDWRKVDWSEQDNKLLKSMVQRGHEIGAHSITHDRTQLEANPKGEVEDSKRWIEERLDVEVPSYCYPFYIVTEPIKNAVISVGYKQARWGTKESYYSSHSQIDYFQVDCRQITTGENVDGWLQPGAWHILTFHGIGTGNDGWEPIPVVEFERQMTELAKHRDSGAVEVVTFKEGADRLRRSK
ncbi:MAG TPA: polysaccharide deacetylase family protein [Candidatus Limnocylindrales bacterium]|nr:polysaccharide deacetylase family protein [Candidatus Limnocylindrales bacterium]